jgi:hypothetical protein
LWCYILVNKDLSAVGAHMQPLLDLVARWMERGALLRDEGCSEIAAARERCAAELEACVRQLNDEALSPAQGARESGYSEEHLRRLLRQHPELNCGRSGKPSIRRRDLPRKPLACAATRKYDAVADARSLMSRQGAQ